MGYQSFSGFKTSLFSNWGSGTKSYHNGGVEGDCFADWYEKHLAVHFKDDADGSGSGGTKGSGSGGTKGSGSGGTKGSGSGGTKGSGSGGTKGSGSGGTKGSGSGGTKGSDTCDDAPEKLTMTYMMGDHQIDVNVTEGDEGTLFFDIRPTDPDAPENIDIDGLFFDVADDAKLGGLMFSPDGNSIPVTNVQADANAVSMLTNGQGPGSDFDAAVQFGQFAGSTEGEVEAATFTLWSTHGPLSFEDLDLSNMQVVVNSDGDTPEFLPVSSVSNNWGDADDGETCDTDGSGGTKDSGSGGTKGSGSGGTKGSGSGGTKGSGSGGTKGSGSGGTKGSGSGGTKGSGSGGTKGSGSGGTKGSGSGGTKGSDHHRLPDYEQDIWKDYEDEDVVYCSGSGSGGTKGSGDKTDFIAKLMSQNPDDQMPDPDEYDDAEMDDDYV